MAVFKVRRRVDAFVDYVTDVEAASAQEAAEIAHHNEADLPWEEEGPCEFDDRRFITLAADGSEIAETEISEV